MSAQNSGRRGGSRGGFRGRGGGGGGKRKAPVSSITALASGAATPALTSGQSTPAPSGTPSALDGAKTQTRFRDLPGLGEALLKNIPFEFCTEVQAATLPSIIEEHDVLAQAKTGTGKTLAFLVPSIQRLLNTALTPAQYTSVLVLSPTRELAAQIGDAAKGLLQVSGLGVQCVVGGTNINTDIRNLGSQRADILVATPGRLVDLLENANMKPRLSQIRTLVLDEADRLLDQGFRRELLKILESLPDRSAIPRQTLLFSATLPAEVHSISSIALRPDHHFISTLKEEDINAHEHVVQEKLIVAGSDIVAATAEVLRREEALSAERGGFKLMAFLPTARAAGLFYEIFNALPTSYPVWEIHSRMSQSKRTKATDAFRAADRGVLFSSDVTARGIDVQGVTGVVQIGLPSSGEQYVHRLGRTARAGAKGHGVLILADFETFFLQDKTIRTFDLHDYPAIDATSLAAAQRAVAVALSQVSEESKGQAYQAWLGYYNSNLRNLKWNQAALVQNANDYARYCLQTAPAADGTWYPPALQAKTVGKMGLKGVPGLNVVRGEQTGGGRQGGGAPRQQRAQQQQQQQQPPAVAQPKGKRQQQQQMQRDSIPPPPQVSRPDAPRGRGPRQRPRGGRGGATGATGGSAPRGAIAGGNGDYGGW